MSNHYEKLLMATESLQRRVREMQESAGKDTSKRLLLEQCYSALGEAVRVLVLLSSNARDEGGE